MKKLFTLIATVVLAMTSLPAHADVTINEDNFPDAAFRAFVATLDGGGDGVFTDAEISKVLSINCSKKNIADLTGIEHFTALQSLECGDNQLTKLNVSANTQLTDLKFYNNQIEGTVDLSKNTNLKILYCFNNKLTSLDVKANTKLTNLSMWGNQVATLDVSSNTDLELLYCANNKLGAKFSVANLAQLRELRCEAQVPQLTELDLTGCKALKELFCQDNRLEALDVTACEDLDTLNCLGNYFIKELDLTNNSKLAYLNCAINQIQTLNLANKSNLTHVYCYRNNLDGINVETNAKLQVLDFFNNPRVQSVDVTHNPDLTYLSFYNNKLIKDVDLSQNSKLEYLYAFSAGLSSLDVTHNPALKLLWCHNNKIEKLDLAKNKELQNLDCNNNLLYELDVTANTALTTLKCGNQHLTCLDLTNNKKLTTIDTEGNTRDVYVDYAYMYDGTMYYYLSMAEPAQGETLTDLQKKLGAGFVVDNASNWSETTVSKTTTHYAGSDALMWQKKPATMTYNYNTDPSNTNRIMVPTLNLIYRLILTGVDEIENGGDVRVYATEGTLHIAGSDAKAEVYDFMGRNIYSGADREIALPVGAYIVKVGATTHKVMVK